jgi:hypothetical protein
MAAGSDDPADSETLIEHYEYSDAPALVALVHLATLAEATLRERQQASIEGLRLLLEGGQ